MSYAKKRVYFVVNEGEVVYASLNSDDVEDKASELREADLKQTVEDSGRDIDDLTDEELVEFGIASGFNGGCYCTHNVRIPKHFEEDECFETDDGDEIRYIDVVDAIDDDGCDDMYDGD